MLRWLQSLLFVVFSLLLSGQQTVWINELDCDTPGLDVQEFIELKSSQPSFSLNSYVVVFFNGADKAGNSSYLAIDLSGYTTDINGLFVIGNSGVEPFPHYIIPDNTIQNGADGVAVYRRDILDFPDGTTAFVDSTLIDVMVYGTNDPDAVTMLDIFRAFDPNIKQLNEGKSNNTNSIQRDNNGGYFIATPTPRRNNDGSGIDLNGLRVIFQNSTYREGDTILLTFETERDVESDLILNYTLDNGSFNGSDYIATNRLSIRKGTNTITSPIIIVEDGLEEGDEELFFQLAPLSGEYLLVNNNITIRILDNDFKISDFGTPLEPTYGQVSSTQINGYYNNLNGLKGEELKQALQDIIADESVVRAQTYNDVVDILKEADQNPKNSNQVWLVYTEQGRSKIDFQLTSENTGAWNREHVWPRSRGVFFSIEGDNVNDGIDEYWNTNADSLRHGNSDAHHLRAVDGPENSKRGNKFYGEYTGPVNTAGSFRGDVARSIFYMAVRYNNLDLVEGYPEGTPGRFGDLTTLLNWHQMDQPDDFEVNRNNVVQKWQYNRNPFIDLPDLAEYIWGNKRGEIWYNPTSTKNIGLVDIRVFPNPTSNAMEIDGLNQPFNLDIINMHGQTVRSIESVERKTIDITNILHGTYILKITTQDKNVYFNKIVIQ